MRKSKKKSADTRKKWRRKVQWGKMEMETKTYQEMPNEKKKFESMSKRKMLEEESGRMEKNEEKNCNCVQWGTKWGSKREKQKFMGA